MNEVEVWKPVPSVLGTEASSRGRIYMKDMIVIGKDGKERTIKGGIRPQHGCRGYQTVDVFCGGKWYTKNVHRLVAEAFIPNSKGLEQVNHKNCIRDDNRVENLEWCSNKYNIEYREKYGKSAAEALGRPLWAFNLKTFEKRHFDTRLEAERELGVDNAGICAVIKGKKPQAGGYYFTESDSEVTKEGLRAIKYTKPFLGGVIAISAKKQRLLYFESQREAERKLGVFNSNINKVLRGHRNHTGGYWFTNADKNAVENTRAKFGDEVANKVARLISEN